MKNSANNHSLLPYLDNGRELFLRLTTAVDSSVDLDGEAFPFVVLNGTDPVARLVQGALVTDTEETAKALFVLLERDDYRLRDEPLLPVTNRDVEEAWQRAFSFYRSSGQDTRLLTLGCQVAENGRLCRLPPLFVCKVRHLFFHPICPRCGLPLQLCTDDDRLIDAGLGAYSCSLKRYLSCGFSTCEGSFEFYARERTVSDPPVLKGFRDLVRAFSGLLDTGRAAAQFPCTGCDDARLCFGEGQQALSRIALFSFYPFHMLIFEAMSVNGLDFSFLLSGAPPDEVAARLKSLQEGPRARAVEALLENRGKRFLFENDERFFLEVLYLKLSFLASIVRDAPAEDHLVRPGFAFALDRIWVGLADQTSFLPFYWTFTTRPLDVFWPTSSNLAKTKTSSRPDLYCLGLIWFYVLTVNRSQGVPEVLGAIREGMERYLTADQESNEGLAAYSSRGVFSPSNIFWSPDIGGVPRSDEAGAAFWERAQSFGWSLLKAAATSGEWSKARFVEEVESLAEDVHRDLFSPALPLRRSEAPSLDDRAIRVILDDIISRWRTEAEQKAKIVAERAEPEWEEESVRTVIVTSQPGFEAVPSTSFIESDDLEEALVSARRPDDRKAGRPPAQDGSSDDGMDKTVILSAKGHAGEAGSSTGEEAGWRERSGEAEDVLEKTMVFSRTDLDGGATVSTRKDIEGIDLDKTKILSVDTAAGVPPAQDVPERRKRKSAEEDEMEKTVIIVPSDWERRR